MSYNAKYVLKNAAWIFSIILVVCVLLFFIFRNAMLRSAIEKANSKLTSTYQTQLIVGDAYFSGIATIHINGLMLIPSWADTLATVHTLKSTLSVSSMLFGEIRLSELHIEGALFKINEQDTLAYQAQLKQNSTTVPNKETTKREANIAKVIYRWIDLLFDIIPPRLEMENCRLVFIEKGIEQVANLKSLVLIDQALNSELEILTGNRIQHWLTKGTIELASKKADISMFTSDTQRMQLPLLKERYQLNVQFRQIGLLVHEVEFSGGKLTLTGDMKLNDVVINHPKISSKDVLLPAMEFHYQYRVGEQFVMLDSSSYVRIEKLQVHPYVHVDVSADTIIQMAVVIPRTQAQDFVNALPEGLFNHIRGMQIAGAFDFRMDFVYNENKPRDLYFETAFNKYDLAILKYGEANIGKLNGDFIHVPTERGKPVRPIEVGTGNPNYTPLDQVSPFLQSCVLTCEDPSFFYHRGFIDEAFRQSIIKNIRTRKFARGASTISMQLVKNVFLTREKTLSRKLEEILLVYIIENNRLVSKQRMLEVYFNIIEWGPNIYGIGEASAFYFNKHPSQLNLSECLFLATIIPRPKGFMWRFDKQGLQKEFVGKQYSFLTHLMIKRHVLMPEDTLGINYQIPITGKAKEFIKIVPDSSQADTILMFDTDGRLKSISDED